MKKPTKKEIKALADSYAAKYQLMKRLEKQTEALKLQLILLNRLEIEGDKCNLEVKHYEMSKTDWKEGVLKYAPDALALIEKEFKKNIPAVKIYIKAKV